MKILVVGNGGREHALVWKLSQSSQVEKVFCAPGNAGTAQDGENVPIPVSDTGRLRRFAKENKIDLTIIGPEAPLVEGIVDEFQAAGLRVFGPQRKAAQLEGSKAFAKSIMQSAGVPTSDYRAFSRLEEATTWIDSLEERPLVVKADGLAAGKGVVMCGWDRFRGELEAGTRPITLVHPPTHLDLKPAPRLVLSRPSAARH